MRGVNKESPAIGSAVQQRQAFGSTEKIRRRNRKTWTRLANKIRRALGKDIIVSQLSNEDDD